MIALIPPRYTPCSFLGVLLTAGAAQAQAAGLLDCVPYVSMLCSDAPASTYISLQCPQRYDDYFGRVAWQPLAYHGPIIIEVNARRFDAVRLPLYIEIIPLGSANPIDACDLAGRVVLTAAGGAGCDDWESSGVLVLPLRNEELYVVRATFMVAHSGWVTSPPLGCIRVTSTSALQSRPWGLIKSLYRSAGP